MLPVIETFLHQYLPFLNGENIEIILDLLSKLRPCSYEELYGFVLRHLQRVFFTGNVVVKVKNKKNICLRFSGENIGVLHQFGEVLG